MDWRYLDRVDGIAIDNDNTLAHHQLISLSKDQNTLHYTVFYEPLYKQQKESASASFIQAMNVDTPLDTEGQRYVSYQYMKFFKEIRPHGRSCGFRVNELAKALTFDIKFNQKMKMVDMSYRPTLGYMTEKITYKNAAKKMLHSDDLKMMHDIALSSSPKKSRKKGLAKIPFEEVVMVVGSYVHKNKLAIDFQENMDCIFRYDAKPCADTEEMMWLQSLPLNLWGEYRARYHSIHKHLASSDDNALPREAVIPITASRKDVDHYNIMVSAETMMTGESPFLPGTSEAVANFKKHQMVWQRRDAASAGLLGPN